MPKIIYFDNSATTKISPEAAKAALYVMEEAYGNPSSLHRIGVEASRLLKESRDTFSRILESPGEIIFTSGGTESNNTAINGIAFAHQKRANRILISAVEHPSVSETALNLSKYGFRVELIPVDKYGKIALEALDSSLGEDVGLVSLQHVNNENGTIQPLEEAGSLIRNKAPRAFLHIDGVQGFCKLPTELAKWKADLYSASGHKLHAPKGCGILWVRKGVRLLPLLQGGGQEKNLRSGTENLPGIYAFSVTADISHQKMAENSQHLQMLRDNLHDLLKENLPDFSCNSNLPHSAPHILNISWPGLKSEVLLHYLEGEGVYVSSGSACHSNKKASGSPVLKAMGLSSALVDSALRFSFSPENTLAETEKAVEIMTKAIKDLRFLS